MLVAPKISAMVMPTPSTAVSSGIPAARSEPRVITRTTSAISTPMPSARLSPGRESLYASPPTDACPPGISAWSSAVCSARASKVASVMLPDSASNRSEMIAARLSSEITPRAYSSKGEIAWSIWSIAS